MHDSLWLLIKPNGRKLGKNHNHNKQHPFFKNGWFMVERKITFKFTTLDFGIECKLISWEIKPNYWE